MIPGIDMAEESSRQRAYLVARPIFSGSNAHLRKAKRIRELILSHSPIFNPLLHSLGEQDLVVTIQGLLKDKIFDGEIRAKAEFPSLFSPVPQRDLEHEMSEADAARSAQDAAEQVDSADEYDPIGWEEPAAVPDEVPEHEEVDGVLTGDPQILIPSLYPCYIPYGTQHLLLTTVQRSLEESCFEFAKRWLPHFLEKRGWDCPAAVELTKWANFLGRHSEKLPAEAFDRATPLKTLLVKNHLLRHTAVHRLPTTARAISQLLQNAIELTSALYDHRRAAQLDTLKCELDSKIKAMELNKNVLENQTTEKLQDIRRQREELVRQERELLENMVSEDLRNKALVGTLLEQSIDTVCAPPVRSRSGVSKHREDVMDSASDESDAERTETKADKLTVVNMSYFDDRNESDEVKVY